jgi:transcriptional regulator with XRE-family HTH domain
MDDLKAWRKARNFSQAKLAQMLATTQPTISAIENGDEKISLELSARIFALTSIGVGKLKNATEKQARAVIGLTVAAPQ